MPPKDKTEDRIALRGWRGTTRQPGGSKPLKKNKMKDERKESVVWNADSEQLQVKQLNFREKFKFPFPINSQLWGDKSPLASLEDRSRSLEFGDPREAGGITARTMTVIRCSQPLTSAAARLARRSVIRLVCC